MHKFLLSLFTAAFALQPAFAYAYSVPGAARTSRRTIVQTYRTQNQNRALTLKGASKGTSAASVKTYAPVGGLTPALPANGYTLGDVSAPITVVEFLDYACPFCAQFSQKTLPTIQSRYIDTGKVRFVFRNMPLSYHPAAGYAAEVVECSRQQSETYALQLQKKLFAITAAGDLTADDVDSAAQLPGIDTKKLADCVTNGQAIAQITADITDAFSGGVSGVPSFWVLGSNGKAELIQGNMGFDTFQKVFDTMLK